MSYGGPKRGHFSGRHRSEGTDAFRGDQADNGAAAADGLPCTPFSTVGQKKGRHDENNLMMECVRAVRQVAPKALLFENVEGLLHSRHADYVAFPLREFSKAGHSTEIHRINARDHGVAQNRTRIMLVGMRKNLATAFRTPRKFPELATNVGAALATLWAKMAGPARKPG